MTEETIVTNIVAKSNFSDLIGDLNRVSTQLSKLQAQLVTTNRALANQAAQMQKSFATTLRSTGQFSTHFVSLASDVDKFGKSLDSGQLKLSQYYGAWKEHTKTAGGLIRDLAKQQVQMQNAILQPLGKNAQGLMQFNVHVPQGLDEIKNKTAIANQELKIMNKVIQDGANQFINWGKNTQWAGRQLTMGLTLPIAAFGAAAQKAFLEADQQLVRLTKVYGGVAQTSTAELKKIRNEVSATARDLAKAYGASYKDTISLAADIAATGKTGNELLKSTAETTRLSILGEVDRQEAMKATLAIQTAFKQNTTQLGESINFLNAVENQTSTSLQDLVEAIPKAGPVIQAMGGSIKDLALYMTAMKEGGISASEGANALKSAMASLVNPTKVAKDMFAGFGIDLGGIVTKNAGNLTGTILELQGALDKLNPLQKQQAIEQLFGKFQFARMNALFANLGKQGSQTLQVLDLMKASSTDLANIASREMTQMTESASGKYKRALETLKADMAGVGDSFLNVSTKILNVLDKVINFFNHLPKPIKAVATFIAGLTAIAGPIIMLTGLLANFFGYIAKGIFHFKAFLKGGEGFKLLTPEILAAEQAGSLMEKTFYDDAKAAAVLKQAIAGLTAELSLLQVKATTGAISVAPAIETAAGAVIMSGRPDNEILVNKNHPLVGQPYTRQMAHLVPKGVAQPETIFGVVPNPGPVNQKISKNLQMYSGLDMPRVEGASLIRGINTGIIPTEAAKWHSMTGALAMQSEAEIKALKAEVYRTGTVSTSVLESYQALLPQMTMLTQRAADESAIIVAELEAGKITVDTARSRITALNIQIENMMGEAATGVALAQGKTIDLKTVPLTKQPVVDPLGRSNMKELFHKGSTKNFVDALAGILGVRTSGAGYSRETTFPRVTVAPFLKRNEGGHVYDPRKHGAVVPGDTSINYDNTPAMLPLHGFVLNQKASLNPRNQDLVAMADGSPKGGSSDVPAIVTPGETVYTPEVLNANPGLRETLVRVNNGYAYGGTIVPAKSGYGAPMPRMIFAAPKLRSRFIPEGLKKIFPKAFFDTSTGGNATRQREWLVDSISMFGRGYPKPAGGFYSVEEILAMPEKEIKLLWNGIEKGHFAAHRTIQGSDNYFAPGLMGPQSSSANKSAISGGSPQAFLHDLENVPIHPMVIMRSAASALGYDGSPKQFIKAYEALIKGLGTRKTNFKPGDTFEMFSENILRKHLIKIKSAEGKNFFDDLMSYGTVRGIDPQRGIDPITGEFISGKGSLYAARAEYAVGGNVVLNKNGYGYKAPAWTVAGNTGRSMFKGTYKSPLNLTPEYQAYLEETAKRIWDKLPKDANGQVWHTPDQLRLQREGKSRPFTNPQPKRYYQDLSNDDPAHGTLHIARYQPAMHVRNSYVGPQLRWRDNNNWRAIDGFSRPALPLGTLEDRAKASLFRYMQGDYQAIADKEVQAYLSSIRSKFTGTLHRGVNFRSTDSLPPFIKNLIAQKNWEELVGKEFIMRRASWSKNPKTAQGFGMNYNGSLSDQVILTATVKNRNAVPASEIFPDLTFQTAKGPVKVNENEVYMGGKFRVVAAGQGKIKLQAVYDQQVDGKRENGGPVNAGRPYLVGEKGPELFVPKNAGGIISHYQLGGMIRASQGYYGNMPKINHPSQIIDKESANAAARSNNPAIRAAGKAWLQANKFTPAPVSTTPIKPGPMSVQAVPFTGVGGVRGNAYAPTGSLPYLPMPFKRTLYATDAVAEATSNLNKSIKQLTKVTKDAYQFQKTRAALALEGLQYRFTDFKNQNQNAKNINGFPKDYFNGWRTRAQEMPQTWKELLFTRKGWTAGLARPIGPDGKPIMNERMGFKIYSGRGGAGIGEAFSNHPMATTLALSAAGTYAGQEVAKKNQTLGNIVSTVTGILPWLLMGKMQAAQAARGALVAQATQNAGKYGNVAKEIERLKQIQRVEKVAAQTGKSVSEAEKLVQEGRAGRAIWSARTASVANKARGVGRFAFGFGVAAKTGQSAILGSNPIGWAVEAALITAQSGWIYKRHVEDIGKANRAVFGPTKKSLQEVGIEYSNVTDKVRSLIKYQEEFRNKVLSSGRDTKGKLVGGLTLTKDQLDKEVKRIKDSKSETVQDFNKTYGKTDVLKLAVSLKQQYIAAGMSATEATNKVYAFMKASNKASYAFSAITSSAFKNITDQATAADYAMKIVIQSMKSAKAEEIATGVQNIVTSLDGYKNSLIGTKDENGKIIDEYKAQQMALDKIIKLKGSENKLSSDTVDSIKKQDLYLGSVLSKNETLQGVYAKSALLQNGYGSLIDVGALTSQQAVTAAQGMEQWQKSIAGAVGKTGNLAKEYTRLGTEVKNAQKVQLNQDVQKALENKIKLQDKLIKKIQEETDARLKALDAEQKSADFNTSLKKEQLAYQNALASGDMTGAAQAQLNIQALIKQKQIDDAKQSITDAANARIKAAEVKKEGYQNTINVNQDKVNAAQQTAQDNLSSQMAVGNYLNTVDMLLSRLTPDTFKKDSKDKNSASYLAIAGIKQALQDLSESGPYGKKKAADIQSQIDKTGGYASYISSMLGEADKNAASSGFGKAVDVFQAAVNKFAKTNGYTTYRAPDVGEYRAMRGQKDTTYEVFADPTGKLVQVKANSGNYEDVFNKMIARGYVFKQYAPRGLNPDKVPYYTSTSFAPDYSANGGYANGGHVNGYAPGGISRGTYVPGMGGYIRGNGTPTSDSILLQTGSGGFIKASDKEYMQPASAVSYYGTDVMDLMRSRSIPKELFNKYAMGGSVNSLVPNWMNKDKYPQYIDTPGPNDTPGVSTGGLYSNSYPNPLVYPDHRRRHTSEWYLKQDKYMDQGIPGFTGMKKFAGDSGINKNVWVPGSLVRQGMYGIDSIAYAMGGAIPGYATAGPLHDSAMLWGGKNKESLWSKVVHGGVKAVMKHFTPTLFGKNIGYDFGGGKEVANVLSGTRNKGDYAIAGLSMLPGGTSVKTGSQAMTKGIGISAFLSKMFKPTENYYGQQLFTNKQIRQLFHTAGTAGGGDNAAFAGAKIRRVAPWRMQKGTAGYYENDLHRITLPWQVNAGTVLHEGLHALDFQKHHWSYENLFRYLHATGRHEDAANLVEAYKKYTAPGQPGSALYAKIGSTLLNKDYDLYARFKGYAEGNAEDRFHSIAKWFKNNGDPEMAKVIGSPYAGGQAYFSSLQGLLKASIEKGYMFYRNPNFVEGLLEVSRNMPEATKERLASWIPELKKAWSEPGGFEKLLNEAKLNGWATGGSLTGLNLPKFHKGGQVHTTFAGGETMALLKDKEHVFTPEQMEALSGRFNVSGGERTYTIAPVIHAAPGMDENAIADIATRKMLDALKIQQYNEARSLGVRRDR